MSEVRSQNDPGGLLPPPLAPEKKSEIIVHFGDTPKDKEDELNQQLKAELLIDYTDKAVLQALPPDQLWKLLQRGRVSLEDVAGDTRKNL